GIVRGFVFMDNNDGDGLYVPEDGDTPIANVDVRIIDKNGVTNTVTTDIHGFYTKVIDAGPAMVDVVTSDPDFPLGKILTYDDYGNGSDPTLVTVPDGGIATDDTGYITPDAGTGEVIGFVFVDWNTNGVFDVHETPLAGIAVAITDTNGFTFTVTTDPSGFFSQIVDAGLTIVDVVN